MPGSSSGPFHDPVILGGVIFGFTLFVNTVANPNYNVTQQDRYVYVDATLAASSVVMPAAASVPAGFTVGIKKKDSGGNAVTVNRQAAGAGSTDTFDGATSVALAAQFNSVLLVSDGVSQWIRSSNAVATGGF